MEKSLGIKDSLHSWAVRHNITATVTSDLLNHFKNEWLNNGNSFDVRTLLNTNISILKSVVQPDHYIYFGLDNNSKILVNNYLFENIHELNLFINVDGLPLFKSSPGQSIPILIKLINIPQIQKVVLPVGGLYYGFYFFFFLVINL